MSEQSLTGIQKKEDLSGKDRVVLNVLSSWASHLVLIVIGFILPRMINDQLGQVSLGIWDLSWSFVNYLSLAGYGVGSSVNRYVAKYRAIGDYKALNKALSSVVFIQLLSCLVVLVSTAILVWLLPSIVGDKESVDIQIVSWVVGLLGMSLAAQLAFDPSRGLLTGMHRWDLYNGLNTVTQILSAALMIAALLMGGGLISLAAVYLSVTLFMDITRSILATRLCKELDLKKKLINWKDIKKMFRYGAKSFIASSPSTIVIQTMNIIIASVLGPAALAIFARPLALVRHVEVFLNKFSFVLTPMVGSISASGRTEELREFLVDTTKYSIAFTLPIILFLVMLGDVVLEVWMGKEYVNNDIILVLSVGFFLKISQAPALRILMGMNAHGRVALINLFLTALMFVIGLVIFSVFGWDLVNIAIFFGIIFSVTSGFITPLFACRAVKIGYVSYFFRSFTAPIVCNVVAVLWFFAVRQFDQLPAVLSLIAALSGELIMLSFIYWMFILPATAKQRVYSKIATVFRLSETL
jgi:O-antigen/teichoic acid export membrane protein